jgi:hypothetical protein
MAINEFGVREAFEEINERMAGRPFDVVVAALQDLLVASLCYACPDKAAAKALCEDIHRDLQKTIDKNFEHYHDQKNAVSAAKRRSH